MLTWSTKELAEIFEVSVVTVRGWIHKGYLKGVKVSNYDGLEISSRSLFEFFETHKNYHDIFTKKLTTNSYIGDKDSRSVMQYLLKVGLLK